MTNFERAARGTITLLDALAAPHALVGGFAVSVRTEPRFTRDIDLAVAVPSDEEAEAVVRELTAHGYEVQATVEHAAAGRLATVRMAMGGGDDVVDLLFASSGIEEEICARAERLEILPGLLVPVARTGDLIALKLLAADERTRPHDASDLRALVVATGDDDLHLARSAAELIQARGYHRGRDLVAALADLIASRRDGLG